MDEVFLGIDGGGTKTLAVLVSSVGKVLGRGLAGSTDCFNFSEQEVLRNLGSAVDRALATTGLKKTSIAYSCVGLSSYGDVPGLEDDLKALVGRVIPGNLRIENDVRLALEGAHSGKPGIVFLNGTGTMAMGKDETGKLWRSDGWGEHVGDMGSGYFIGRKILQIAFKEYDGRITGDTRLLEMVMEKAGLTDIREMLPLLSKDISRSYIASFSTVASEAAKLGDKFAESILDEAVGEMIMTLEAVGAGFSEKTIPVSFAGGTFNSDYVLDAFKNRVTRLTGFSFKAADLKPELGAIILASEMIYSRKRQLDFVEQLKAENS